jgi:hypothetical protein
VAHHSLDVVSHQADITAQRQAAGGNSVFDVTRAQALKAHRGRMMRKMNARSFVGLDPRYQRIDRYHCAIDSPPNLACYVR